MTLAELAEEYKKPDHGLSPMMLDNDDAHVVRHDEDWVRVDDVFQRHPEDLLREALALLGIPWENV